MSLGLFLHPEKTQNSMLDVLLTASVSFIISFLAIPVILQIADQKKLFDVPD